MYKFLLSIIIVLAGSTVYATDFFHNNQVVREFVVEQKTIEVDPDFALGLQGSYDLKERLVQEAALRREERLRAELDAKDAKLDKLLDALIKYIDSKNNCPPDDKPTPTPTPDPKPEPEPDPTPDTPTSLETQVYNVFKNNKCFQCHNDKDAQGDVVLGGDGKLNLLSLPEREVVIAVTERVLDLSEHGLKAMPLGGNTVPTADVDVLKKWVLVKALEELKK